MITFYENLYYEIKGTEVRIQHFPKRVGCDAHLHHHIEIVVVLGGKLKVSIDAKEYMLHAGDIAISFPNQVHMYQDLPECEGILMIFPPDYCDELEGVFKKKTPVESVVIGADDTILRFAAEVERAAGAEDSEYARATIKGYMSLFLSRLLQRMIYRDSGKADHKTLRSILDFCSEYFMDEKLSLDVISKELNISKYYISHIFNDKLKISFTDYISSLRVREACLKLTSGEGNISEIAYSCGFNSIRSFNRHFLSLTGQTPSKYRDANTASQVVSRK